MNNRNDSNTDKSYYEILGVPETADTETINQAYKAKAKIFHPDRTIKLPAETKAKYEEIFKDISNAHDVLSDPIKRLDYDALKGFNQVHYYPYGFSPFNTTFPTAGGFFYPPSTDHFAHHPHNPGFGFSANSERFFSKNFPFNPEHDFTHNNHPNTSSNDSNTNTNDNNINSPHGELLNAAYSASVDEMKNLMFGRNLLYLLNDKQVVKQLLTAIIDVSNEKAKNVDQPDLRVKLLTFLFKDCNLKIQAKELRSIVFPKTITKLNFKIYAYLQSQIIKLSEDLNDAKDVKKDVKMYGRFRHLANEGLDMLNDNAKDLFKLYYHLNPNHTVICSQVHEKIQAHQFTVDKIRNMILNEKTDKKRNSLTTACLFYYATKNCHDGLVYLRLLIEELGANVNAQNRHGYLLIHHTYLTSKFDEKFKYLVEQGANVYAKDPQNKSIYDLLQHDQTFLDFMTTNNIHNRYHYHDHFNNFKNHKSKSHKHSQFFKALIKDKQQQIYNIDVEIDLMNACKRQ